jgi:aspartate racemase
MRTIGVLGGMSWVSTAEYYRLLNTAVADRLGGSHSARLALVSVDMGLIDDLMRTGQWDEAARVLAADARAVEAAGADLFILATNSLHNVWDEIVDGLSIPAIHIGDATGEALAADGHQRVALLGTRYTMELPFLRDRLTQRFGIDAVVPDASDRETVSRIVFEELVRNVLREQSRAAYLEVIDRVSAAGATAVIFGCTEIGLLLQPEDVPLPVYDTARLHAAAAVEAAFSAQDT